MDRLTVGGQTRRSLRRPCRCQSAFDRDLLAALGLGRRDHQDERCLSCLRCGAGAARQEEQARQDRCFGPRMTASPRCQLRLLNRQLSLPVSTMCPSGRPRSETLLAGNNHLPNNKTRINQLNRSDGFLGDGDYRKHFFGDSILSQLMLKAVPEQGRYSRLALRFHAQRRGARGRQ